MSNQTFDDKLTHEFARHMPRHAQFRFALQARVKTMASGDRLPSIAALQAEFGLAQGTVVRGLRDLQHAGLIEGRHGSGYYATGQRQLLNIAIYFNIDILHPEAGTFPRLLLKGLAQAAGQFEDMRFRHYFTVGSECLWHDRICALKHDVQQRMVDGIVLFGLFDGDFSSLRVPVVGWQFLPNVTSHVAVDELALVRKGLHALRARGCRSVAFLSSHVESMPPADSPFYALAQYHKSVHDGFLHEARQLGLETHKEWIAFHSSGPGTVESRASESFRKLWTARDQKPDGLLSMDDYRTRGALAAAASLGILPAKNLHVATHVNRGSDVLAGQPVIRIEVDPIEVAHALLQAVRDQVQGGAPARVLVAPHINES